MERIETIYDILEEAIHKHVSEGIENVDTSELGVAIDMLKDLSEAKYYNKVTDSMNKGTEQHDFDDVHDMDSLMEKMKHMTSGMTPDEKLQIRQKMNAFIMNM